MDKKINWGIIGLGKIAHKFVQGLSLLPDAQLWAVASRSQEKANDFAQKYQATKAYGTYEAIVQDPEVDVIYIATPHTLHYENTLMCLEHKKAVLCEKPLAMNLAQVQEMVNKARQQETFFMEALWSRFLPSFQKVQEIINSGVLGEITGLQADFGFKAPYNVEGRLFNKKLGGGALLDVGIYPLFFATFLLGRPQSLQAKAYFGQTHVDEHCGMLLSYDSGAIATLSCSITSNNSIEANIFGTEKRLKLTNPFYKPHTKISLIEKHTEEQAVEFTSEGNGYNYEASEVMHCLRKQQIESNIMSHQDSIFLMEMLDWVREEAGIHYDES